LDGLRLEGAPPDPVRRAGRDAVAASPGGLAALASELRLRDPAGAAAVDLRNPRRGVRALGLVAAAGSVAAARGRGPAREATVIGLDAPPPLHRRLVAERSARLLRSGALAAELESALAAGVSEAALDAAGIGYREALALRAGRYGLDEAV